MPPRSITLLLTLRAIAKHYVAAGWSDRCAIQLSYAIGYNVPTSVYIDLHDGSDTNTLTEIIRSIFDLSPKGVIDTLHLLRPIYSDTSVYGHFGQKDFPWEVVN